MDLLRGQPRSGLSIQAFCEQHSIPAGSFHNWKRKYGPLPDSEPSEPSFTPLRIKADTFQQLFAEVGNMKLYQPVSAEYLKELAS